MGTLTVYSGLEKRAADSSKPDKNIQMVENEDGTRFFAPGYEHGILAPSAWIEVSRENRHKIPTNGMFELNIPEDGGEQYDPKTNKILLHVNLYPKQTSAKVFNELTGGQFSDRIEALFDVMRFEDAARAAKYWMPTDSGVVIPPLAEEYLASERAWLKRSAELSQQGVIGDEKQAIVAEEHDKHSRFMQRLQDAYLEHNGFTPFEPNEVREQVNAQEANEVPIATGQTLLLDRVSKPSGHGAHAKRTGELPPH